MTQSQRPPVPGMPPRPPVPGMPPRPPAPKAPAAGATPTAAPATVAAQPKQPATPTASATPRGRGPSPGHPTLREIVKRANDEGASDVHLGVNEPPRFRKRGDITPLEWPITDLPTFMSWLTEVLTDEEIQQFQENLDFDGAADLGFVRIRINLFDALNGPSLVLRLIGSTILTLEQLKLPEVFKKICNYHKGLILVTGPTGSGKSTTLAAMIDYMNRNYAYNIITIEDPVEFVHESKKALIKHREVGRHTLKFFNALKGALRQDPDVLLVGEIRDKETMQIALKAAQTGHLVAGTLHTNSAVKTITRILDMFTAEEQSSIKVSIAESLVAIIAQLLCKTTDGKRAAFHDILINTDVIKEYIVKDKYEEINQIMLKDTYEGMTTMNKSLYNLYQEGRITEEICLDVSPFPNEMSQMLRGRV